MTGEEIDAMLAADPAFETVCDARREAWLAAHEAAADEPPPLSHHLSWCGDRDGDDAAEMA